MKFIKSSTEVLGIGYGTASVPGPNKDKSRDIL